ncbi:hypothetical protein SynBIOSE41_00507 [Synechococcus sp. BIOS-E4-1]|nr:hypothetical protein SynBIOSE41_00507 [Synechococcus sp. BIOS-E4-1]
MRHGCIPNSPREKNNDNMQASCSKQLMFTKRLKFSQDY